MLWEAKVWWFQFNMNTFCWMLRTALCHLAFTMVCGRPATKTNRSSNENTNRGSDLNLCSGCHSSTISLHSKEWIAAINVQNLITFKWTHKEHKSSNTDGWGTILLHLSKSFPPQRLISYSHLPHSLLPSLCELWLQRIDRPVQWKHHQHPCPMVNWETKPKCLFW